MIVFKITVVIYSEKLTSSGNPARWNTKDVKIIYTAGSRALACLENVVHRTSRGLQQNFKTLLIEIPDNLKIGVIERKNIILDWHTYQNMPYTQNIGDEWVKSQSSPVLRVPSVIIPEEYNYLINPEHKDFNKIKLIATETFEFDIRIKG